MGEAAIEPVDASRHWIAEDEIAKHRGGIEFEGAEGLAGDDLCLAQKFRQPLVPHIPGQSGSGDGGNC